MNSLQKRVFFVSVPPITHVLRETRKFSVFCARTILCKQNSHVFTGKEGGITKMFPVNPSSLSVYEKLAPLTYSHCLMTTKGNVISPKPNFRQLKEDFLEELKGKIRLQVPVSKDSWHDLEKKAESFRFKTTAFGNIVMNYCLEFKNFVAGKSYMDYLDSINVTPHLMLLTKFMHVNATCTSVDEDVVFKIYSQIQKTCTCFDTMTTSDLIAALSFTSRWREGEKLLNDIYILNKPCREDFNMLATAAFINGDAEFGWQMIDRMLDAGSRPSMKMCNSMIDWCFQQENEKGAFERLNRFLELCSSNELFLPHECTEKIKNWFQRKMNFIARYVKIHPDGECCHCNEQLRSNLLTDEEFSELKKYFMQLVIVGEDVFKNTSPKELSGFKNFVARNAPFDIVLDGLNIFYKGDVTEGSYKLCKVVRYLVEKEKKKNILVVGKQHFFRWPKVHLNYLQSNAHCFLSQNISKDDPFFIYAAMYSGQQTCVVSADMLRQHKCLMKEKTSLFKRWQLRHQLYIDKILPSGQMIFKDRILHTTSVQKSKKAIHIPCSSCNDVTISFDPPSEWLCLYKADADFKLME